MSGSVCYIKGSQLNTPTTLNNNNNKALIKEKTVIIADCLFFSHSHNIKIHLSFYDLWFSCYLLLLKIKSYMNNYLLNQLFKIKLNKKRRLNEGAKLQYFPFTVLNQNILLHP